LQKVNLESGKCENAFNLRQINKGLTWKGEPMVCTAEVALLCPRNKMKIASHHLFVICFTCFRNSTYLQRTDSWSWRDRWRKRAPARNMPTFMYSFSTMCYCWPRKRRARAWKVTRCTNDLFHWSFWLCLPRRSLSWNRPRGHRPWYLINRDRMPAMWCPRSHQHPTHCPRSPPTPNPDTPSSLLTLDDMVARSPCMPLHLLEGRVGWTRSRIRSRYSKTRQMLGSFCQCPRGFSLRATKSIALRPMVRGRVCALIFYARSFIARRERRRISTLNCN